MDLRSILHQDPKDHQYLEDLEDIADVEARGNLQDI